MPQSGGTHIVCPLEYADNETFQWYFGADPIHTDPNRIVRPAEFPWREAAIAITITEREIAANMGDYAISSLIGIRVANATRSRNKRMAEQMFGTGAEYQGKALPALGALISESGAGTVGGIDSSIHGWWKNQILNLPTRGQALSPASLTQFMNEMLTNLYRNGEEPDIIVTSRKLWNTFERAMQGRNRQSDTKMADLGFRNLTISGIPVFFDHFCPENRMFFVMTKYLKLRPHPNRQWKSTGDRIPVDQTSLIRIFSAQMGMTCSNRNQQGLLKAA